MSDTTTQEKLQLILKEEGVDIPELLEDSLINGTVAGICINKNCDNIHHYEPDQENGWCESCEDNSVVSGLILAGVI